MCWNLGWLYDIYFARQTWVEYNGPENPRFSTGGKNVGKASSITPASICRTWATPKSTRSWEASWWWIWCTGPNAHPFGPRTRNHLHLGSLASTTCSFWAGEQYRFGTKKSPNLARDHLNYQISCCQMPSWFAGLSLRQPHSQSWALRYVSPKHDELPEMELPVTARRQRRCIYMFIWWGMCVCVHLTIEKWTQYLYLLGGV